MIAYPRGGDIYAQTLICFRRERFALAVDTFIVLVNMICSCAVAKFSVAPFSAFARIKIFRRFLASGFARFIFLIGYRLRIATFMLCAVFTRNATER